MGGVFSPLLGGFGVIRWLFLGCAGKSFFYAVGVEAGAYVGLAGVWVGGVLVGVSVYGVYCGWLGWLASDDPDTRTHPGFNTWSGNATGYDVGSLVVVALGCVAVDDVVALLDVFDACPNVFDLLGGGGGTVQRWGGCGQAGELGNYDYYENASQIRFIHSPVEKAISMLAGMAGRMSNMAKAMKDVRRLKAMGGCMVKCFLISRKYIRQ